MPKVWIFYSGWTPFWVCFEIFLKFSRVNYCQSVILTYLFHKIAEKYQFETSKVLGLHGICVKILDTRFSPLLYTLMNNILKLSPAVFYRYFLTWYSLYHIGYIILPPCLDKYTRSIMCWQFFSFLSKKYTYRSMSWHVDLCIDIF